jgi:hypothetical protein
MDPQFIDLGSQIHARFRGGVVVVDCKSAFRLRAQPVRSATIFLEQARRPVHRSISATGKPSPRPRPPAAPAVRGGRGTSS